MGEQQNTLVCTLDPQNPRISASEIHEWIHEQLRVDETAVTMVQIDVPRRQVYINFVALRYVQDILQETKGQSEYKHTKGEIASVRIEVAGMGTKRVRIANLPPEIN
jgi:hypothetical protein